jgi:TOMM system kinase/cyclase fusion protein
MSLLVPGTRFQNRYDVTSEIGVGSYGRVYRARQISTGQDVALKILRLREGDGAESLETQRQRFQREMQLCAKLSHPHVVRLLDSGEYDDGALYAVFEYVAGRTLREVIDAEGKLAPIEAVHLMTQVLDALACAHLENVVHRDLKPENIMVTHTGLRRNATVLDFGLGGFAAGADEGARLTGSREFMGTPAYAAPEQLRGEALTPSSDLYSWGLILLECLTGEPAIASRSAHDAIVRQLGPEPVTIPTWLRDQRLGRLLVAVTAKEASARDISEQALLKALEAIQRDAGPTREGAPHRLPVAEGERRQVTVLACTTTVAREGGGPLDLEDLDHAMQVQHQLYEDVVHQGGHTIVPGKIGEVHVVFGYPKAHEDDARRAVRMALRVLAETRAVSATLRRERGLALAVRLGLHSGVGILRLRRRGPDGETSVEVVGAPVVLATQLADRAGVEEILASAETRALLREEMECLLVGETVAPDRGTTTSVFRVVGERVGSAFETSVRADETPLVGRIGELSQLTALWSRADAGALGIVLLQGEAGIGKSRLVRELRRRVPPDALIACRCAPEGRDTPLQPLVTWLRALPAPLDETLAALGFDVATAWPLFADLLQVPRGDVYEPLRLAPERQKELTLRTVASLIVRMARRRPMLFVLEDLHWADPTTGELIACLLDEARSAHDPTAADTHGLMLLFSGRPEYSAGWAASDVTVLPLGRLSRADVAAIVESKLPSQQALASDVLDDVVERTDGIPLFVEELAHALGLADEGTIPGTLRELLTTRLDGLSTSAHETAQVAAAIGREVPYPLLRAVTTRDEWVLRQDLMELVDARLLLARRGSGQEAYVFRHALMRDAAYESMVRATRQRIHRAIAEGLREHQPAVAAQQPERLAHHLEAAGDLPAAADHWLRAGDRDFRRAAYAEAAVHLERALTALEKLPATVERSRQQIEALTVLGTVFLCSGGHAHPRVHECFARARELSAAYDLDPSLKIVAHIAAVHIIQGDRGAMDAFLPVCERLLGSSDPVAELTGITAVGLDAFWRGNHRRAHELLERGLPIYRTDKFHQFFEAYGWDGGIYVPLYFLWNSTIMGEAEDVGERARALAARSEDPQAPALVNVFAMASAHARRDVPAARQYAEQAIAVSQDQRFFGLLLLGMCGRGLALVHEGREAEGIGELQTALSMMEAGGAHSPWAYYRAYLAEAFLMTGQLDDGLTITTDSLTRCEHRLARVHEPVLLRIEGELLFRRGDRTAAEDRLHRAVASAKERGALLWERHATASLAELR